MEMDCLHFCGQSVSFKDSAMKIRSLFLLLSLIFCVPVFSQERDAKVEVSVTAVNGESLQGTAFTLWHVGYSLSYPGTVLDSEGKCTVDVYSGQHTITIQKDGFVDYEETFTVAGGETKKLDILLKEDVRTPFALKTELRHDAYAGSNDVMLSWNREEPSFFDDFESYDDFSVQFGEWTGIDGDGLAAAPLEGDYPNRGTMQYAQIINPLTVVLAWWYDYPVLRPYSGNQYVGFIRTSSGAANDDWLISPAIEVKAENILRFMAKAADVYAERFEVGITTEENPAKGDFRIISSGNYETVSYEEWQAMVYDLSEYEGQTVKIGIHYISDANRYGAFMLMVDDFYVGQRDYDEASVAKARRVVQHSPANPNESFKIYSNGVEVGTTEGYSFLLEDLQPGGYTFGVKAVYKSGAESGMAEVEFTVPSEGYSAVTFNVTANNSMSLDGLAVDLVSVDSGDEYSVTVADGKAVLASLPDGGYVAAVESEAYKAWRKEFTVAGDMEVPVALEEMIYTPYNITAEPVEKENGNYEVTVKWNQDLGFSDSFEDYEDFAQNGFGEWITVDADKMPAMPIAVGTLDNFVQVKFPGASTTDNLIPVAPMVFNPAETEPALTMDPWFVPVDGNKEILFLNPYGKTKIDITQTDKWLISPECFISNDYVVRFYAAGYDFSETLEICVSTTDTSVGSFEKIGEIMTGFGGTWTQYEVDMSGYAGKNAYIGIHCVSYGGWVCLFDDFYVGPKEDGAVAYVGNVLSYEVFLDGVSQGTTETASFTLADVAPGTHVVGIEATYESGVSERAEYTFVAEPDAGVDNVDGGGVAVFGGHGIVTVSAPFDAEAEVYNLAGQLVASSYVEGGNAVLTVPSGIYIVKFGGTVSKVVVK